MQRSFGELDQSGRAEASALDGPSGTIAPSDACSEALFMITASWAPSIVEVIITSRRAMVGQRRKGRPMFGLRRRPGRLALALFRLPLNAYRHNAGGLLGHTFLQFTHIGRKSGRPYDSVAMVMRYDQASHEAVSAQAGVQRPTGSVTCAPAQR